MKKLFGFLTLTLLPCLVFASSHIGSCQPGHSCVCIDYGVHALEESQYTSPVDGKTYTNKAIVVNSEQYIDLGDPSLGYNNVTLVLSVCKLTGYDVFYLNNVHPGDTIVTSGGEYSAKATVKPNTCSF